MELIYETWHSETLDSQPWIISLNTIGQIINQSYILNRKYSVILWIKKQFIAWYQTKEEL